MRVNLLVFGRRNLPAVLVLLAIAGLATENLSHYPIAIMCLLGVYHIWLNPQDMLSRADARLLITVFGCIWIPMLLALPDAASPTRALKTTALYVHFLPAGLYLIHGLREFENRRIMLAGLTAIVGFWCVDGMVQLLTGSDLFGYPYDGLVLQGVFYPKQRFGIIFAVFTPLYLYVVHRLAARSALAWLLLAPFVIVVMFSLKRTAWIMFAVALAGFIACFIRVTRANVRSLAIAAGLIAATLVATTTFVPKVHTQWVGTLKIFSADFAAADLATSHRLSLWKTGLSIARAHWLNGVGPRGFRTVYRDYAAADDFWIARGSKGQTHPHLMILEVLIETGVIGLIGFVACLWLLLRRLIEQRLSDPTAAGYLMVAIVAWFPLNAHLAFYGSYWSSIVWIMIALGCAASGDSEERGLSAQISI
ncbi:MAG: O-antigen ligase family protein [Proteobacteria bacterium]|nr:MAG: O-antigen ligase family protein [Pseudomonadota bacterium]